MSLVPSPDLCQPAVRDHDGFVVAAAAPAAGAIHLAVGMAHKHRNRTARRYSAGPFPGHPTWQIKEVEGFDSGAGKAHFFHV